MNNHEILLSTGDVPWLGLEKASNLAKTIKYDGLELVPLRQYVRQIKKVREIYKDD